MNEGLSRTVKLFAAMALGAMCPAAHEFQFLIRYCVMVMLWLAFLDVRPTGFRREHAQLLAANWLIGLAAWAALVSFDRQLAVAALLVGLTPTATAAPVITGMLGGRVDFVAGSVLATNVTAALLFPIVLPSLMGLNAARAVIPAIPFLVQTAGVVLVPLALAQALRVGAPRLTSRILRYRSASFYTWLGVLFLATANGSFFLRTQDASWHAVTIAVLTAGLCVVNFTVGRWIGGTTLAQEASQSLGQKNTMLTIWLALTFVNPLVALGPTFYVICHNTFNAWQLARYRVPGKREQAGAVGELR